MTDRGYDGRKCPHCGEHIASIFNPYRVKEGKSGLVYEFRTRGAEWFKKKRPGLYDHVAAIVREADRLCQEKSAHWQRFRRYRLAAGERKKAKILGNLGPVRLPGDPASGRGVKRKARRGRIVE